MKITPVKTEVITPDSDTLFNIITKNIKAIKDNQVLVITSKIVSLCENSVIAQNSIKRAELITKEADLKLPDNFGEYSYNYTIKNNTLVSSAGIDTSNGKDIYILWPKDPQKTANKLRSELKKHYDIKNLGIIISDSVSQPFRRGTIGIAIAYSGIKTLNDYRDKKDIFGNKIKYTQSNVVGGLAAGAVLAMGEGKEQTPLCIIDNLPFVNFSQSNPNPKELKEYFTNLENDLFAPIIKLANWS